MSRAINPTRLQLSSPPVCDFQSVNRLPNGERRVDLNQVEEINPQSRVRQAGRHPPLSSDVQTQEMQLENSPFIETWSNRREMCFHLQTPPAYFQLMLIIPLKSHMPRCRSIIHTHYCTTLPFNGPLEICGYFNSFPTDKCAFPYYK